VSLELPAPPQSAALIFVVTVHAVVQRARRIGGLLSASLCAPEASGWTVISTNEVNANAIEPADHDMIVKLARSHTRQLLAQNREYDSGRSDSRNQRCEDPGDL
jgi:hypothetical protein